MLKRGIEGDLASRLDDADYRESEYQKLKEGKEDADAIENTKELAGEISGLIDGVFESKDAKQRYSNRLEKARDKGENELQFLRKEIETMERLLGNYRSLFETGDPRVWSKGTIDQFIEWAEQFTPEEIKNKAIEPWREKEYLPRKRVLDQYDAFPDKMKSKGEYGKFLDSGGTKRKELVERMTEEQQKEFHKLIDKSSFSKLDKSAAKRQFDAALEDIHNPDEAFRGIEQRSLLFEQLPDQLKASDKQQKDFKSLNKKIGKYAKGKEKDFAEHFEAQRYLGRNEVLATGEKMLEYFQKIDQKRKEGVISEKTYQDFVDWAVDTGCARGMRGMDLAHRGFSAEMAGRERLKADFDHYMKMSEGIMTKEELKDLEDRFYDKEAGNTERREVFGELRANYREVTKDLGVNESVQHSVSGFAQAADNLFEEAMRIDDESSRNRLLEIAKGSYEKIGDFAKETGNQLLMKHVDDKIKEIGVLLGEDGAEGLNGAAEAIVGLSEEKKEKLKLAVGKLMSVNQAQQQELLRINLMQGMLNHIHRRGLEAGDESQEKRADYELEKAHHKRLHKGLKKRTESDAADKEMMLNKEGQAQKVTKIRINEWGKEDPNNTLREEAEAMREQLMLGDDSKIDSSGVKFENDKGEELKFEEAKAELDLRMAECAGGFAEQLVESEDIQALYREIGDSDNLKGVLAEHMSAMIDDGSLAVDFNRVQASS